MTRQIARTKGKHGAIFSATASLVVGVVLAVGCSRAPSSPSGDVTAGGGNEAAGFAAEPREIWQAIYFGDTKVGHAVTRIRPHFADGRRLVAFTHDESITIARDGQKSTQFYSASTTETDSGQLLRFTSVLSTGESPLLVSGQCSDGSLDLVTQSQGKTQVTRLAWDADWGGFFAVERSLFERPMKPGELRKVTCLLPVFYVAGETDLQAFDFEETKLLEGSRSLLHMQARQKLGGRTLEVEYWTTAEGEVLKMRSPTFDQVTYVTTREQALDAADAGTFDVLRASLVPVEAPFESAHRQRRVRYEVRVTGSPAQGLFRASPQQNVKVIDEHTVELDVRAQAGGSSTSEAGSAELDGSSRALSGADDRPTKGDEAPGSLIQSDDARIVAMAAEAAAEMSDTVELARRLEAYVHDKIENKSFALGFASAAEVAENLEGDCTEHAVLLAALCRARAIPARVAIGLVHLPTASGFAFHMWTEVWTGDRWLSLDATAGRGGTGAGYLKMSHTNLSGSDGFSAMAPVVEVMGRLQIKVLDFE